MGKGPRPSRLHAVSRRHWRFEQADGDDRQPPADRLLVARAARLGGNLTAFLDPSECPHRRSPEPAAGDALERALQVRRDPAARISQVTSFLYFTLSTMNLSSLAAITTHDKLKLS